MDTSNIPLKRCTSKEHCLHPEANDGWLPATDAYFRKQRRRCHACQLQWDRDWRDSHREQTREASRKSNAKHADRVKAYREATKEQHAAYKKVWKEKNRDRIREQDKRYEQTYKERRKELRKLNRPNGKRRAYERQYEQVNKDRIREQNRARRAANPERAREIQTNWRRKHPTAARLYVSRRRTRQLAAPFSFTNADLNTMMEYWNYCCAYCESQRDFWHTIEADHFIPLTGVENTPGTVPTNMIPACKSCNSRKFNRDPVEFVTTEFGKRRATAILARIDAYFEWVKSQTD